MALYVVKYDETLLDVCYNATGAITAIDQIMDANGFDTYTPTLYPWEVLTVPDVIYNSDAVHAANIRPFNNSCGIETDELHVMIDSLVNMMGDIPGPPDDPSIDPVTPEDDPRYNIISIRVKYEADHFNNVHDYVWVESAKPVTSEVKVTILQVISDISIGYSYRFISPGETSSSSGSIGLTNNDTQYLFILEITPSEDDTYIYKAGEKFYP